MAAQLVHKLLEEIQAELEDQVQPQTLLRRDNKRYQRGMEANSNDHIQSAMYYEIVECFLDYLHLHCAPQSRMNDHTHARTTHSKQTQISNDNLAHKLRLSYKKCDNPENATHPHTQTKKH